MAEISIIVPVYKVERYLRKCVDSILKQTFTDFELILVDDGSPDNSGAICDEYAHKDPRVRVIHKQNGGLSDARNAGIEVAKSPYIGFVDSDDFIEADMFELLYRNLKAEKADLSICGIYDLYPGKKPKVKAHIHEVVNQQQAIKVIFEGNIVSVHAYNKLYKRELFANVRYPVGKYHEDSYIILDILEQCQRVVIDSVQKYYYLHREDSITSEQFSSRQFDYIDAWEKNEKRLANAGPELRQVAHQRVCFANFLVLDKILVGNSERQVPRTKKLVKFLRSNIWFILRDPVFTTARKIATLGLAVSVPLYKSIIKLKQDRPG